MSCLRRTSIPKSVSTIEVKNPELNKLFTRYFDPKNTHTGTWCCTQAAIPEQQRSSAYTDVLRFIGTVGSQKMADTSNSGTNSDTSHLIALENRFPVPEK